MFNLGRNNSVSSVYVNTDEKSVERTHTHAHAQRTTHVYIYTHIYTILVI